jgi:hypothetical protein
MAIICKCLLFNLRLSSGSGACTFWPFSTLSQESEAKDLEIGSMLLSSTFGSLEMTSAAPMLGSGVWGNWRGSAHTSRKRNEMGSEGK